MGSLRFSRTVLLFVTAGWVTSALGDVLEQRADCTRTTTAQAGDTCATIAAREGVTVADIIRYNPSITSCSQLTVGGTYCLAMSDTPGSTSSTTRPTSSSPSPPGGSLTPSVDGDCGHGITCLGSKYGDCCSAHGYCGKTDDYCGKGCQSAFGLCAGAPQQSSGSTSTQPTPPPTTSAVPSGGAVTSTIFQTILTTVTVTTTSGFVQPTTSVVVSTKTSTHLVTRTTTSISIVTNTITTIKTISSFAGGGCAATPTGTPNSPTPTLPNTASTCKKYYQIEEGDTCAGIANTYQITLANFYRWNPSVGPALGTLLCATPIIDMVIAGLCKVNCDNLWAGYYVCVDA